MDWLLGIAEAVWASHLHCLSVCISVRERKKIKVVYTLIRKAQFEIGDFEFRTVTEEIPILKDDLVLLKSINH